MKTKPLNRRTFLRALTDLSVGVMAFPYIVPSSALGKDGVVAPSNRLTLAQIGCGGMGVQNLQSFLDFGSEIQVIAVCDVDNQLSKEKKGMVDEKNGNRDCKTYCDFREMLDRESIDIISHAVPDHWHAAITLACAKKGLDMYGEKPFARTIREGRAMCEAIRRYGLVWQTGSWQRSDARFRHAAELVRNGRLGKVRYVEVGLPDGIPSPQAKLLTKPDSIDWQLWLGPAPWRPYQDFGHGGPHYFWRYLTDYSGGELTNWGAHHIDIAHWGLGLDYNGPAEIEGKGEYPNEGIYNVPYAYNFICTYANGIQIRVANSSQLPHGMGTCWYGDKGWIYVNRGQLRASDPQILEQQIGPDEILLYKSQNHHRNFIDCVKSRKETITPAEVAYRSISVALLGEIAMRTGRKLHWNPQTEQFINDNDANRYLMRPYRAPWNL